MKRVEAEFQRTNVTVGQFLSYVRAQLKKRGLDDWAGNLDYEDFIADNGVDSKADHKAKNDEVYALYGIECEIVRDLPYNKQTFEKKANGKVYNEIIEFIFDGEKVGHGYYYLVDDGAEDEVETVETVESDESDESDESVDNDENDSCGERGIDMKMENMIKAVVEAIHRYGEDDNYDPFYGIRGDDRELAPGERFGNSHQLYSYPVDGAEYIGYGLYDAGELDGTCVWSIGLYSAFYEPDANNIRWAIEQAKLFGEHVYLVRSKCPSKSGEELGELIVENAYVALKLS